MSLLHPHKTFRITPKVSYTCKELLAHATSLLHPYRTFKYLCGSLTPKFQAFDLWGLTTPFLLRPTHTNSFHYDLNHESFIGRLLIQDNHTFTKVGEQPYHAPTLDSTRCNRAHECNDANSYIQFHWLIHNYISYNSNHSC